MQNVELGVGRVFLYRGLTFKAGEIYSMDDEVAKELLSKYTAKGIPQFRLTMEQANADPEVDAPEAKALPDLPAESVVVKSRPEEAEEETPIVRKSRTRSVGKPKTVSVS